MRRENEIGVTLVELVVTIAVLAIMLTLAIPTFNDFRQRSALRGAADQVASFIGDARFEALRRDSLVKVGYRINGAEMCIGAHRTTDKADDAPCDCFTAGACDVAAYPESQSDWRGVRSAGLPTVGDTDTDAIGVFVIDPKRASLSQPGDAGRILLQAPQGAVDYRLDVVVDRNARATVCEPSAATAKIPGYQNRRC